MNITPIKAIRLKCLDCCCGSVNEVRLCTCKDCSLYPYRFGKNPYLKPREYTPEQREAFATRLAENLRRNSRDESQNSPAEGKDTPNAFIQKRPSVASSTAPERQ